MPSKFELIWSKEGRITSSFLKNHVLEFLGHRRRVGGWKSAQKFIFKLVTTCLLVDRSIWSDYTPFFGVFVSSSITNRIHINLHKKKTYLSWKSSFNYTSETWKDILKRYTRLVNQIEITSNLPTSQFKPLIIKNYLKPAIITLRISNGELVTIPYTAVQM